MSETALSVKHRFRDALVSTDPGLLTPPAIRALERAHAPTVAGSIVLSFDIEEHYRIEAIHGKPYPADLKPIYAERMETATYRLLDELARAGALGTFYVVGEIARDRPALVKAIHDAGHEVGSHSWDHQSVHRFDAEGFRADLMRSKETLEQVIGGPIYGFRAPTFSIRRTMPWAIDVLSECGFTYDSSIFPVRHDRYGIAEAPRGPFRVRGNATELLELPPLTWRKLGMNIPVAGGGYFRLFPLGMMQAGIRQALTEPNACAMLYFHPWEFDPDQPRLPLGRMSGFRTYVGTGRSTGRLRTLLAEHRFRRAVDVVRDLKERPLATFTLGG